MGHVPLKYSHYINRFLEIESSSISCEITGERLNCGGGYGLEVPCKFTFQGIPELVVWIVKCVIKENAKIETAVNQNQDSGKKKRKSTSNFAYCSKTLHK